MGHFVQPGQGGSGLLGSLKAARVCSTLNQLGPSCSLLLLDTCRPSTPPLAERFRVFDEGSGTESRSPAYP